MRSPKPQRGGSNPPSRARRRHRRHGARARTLKTPYPSGCSSVGRALGWGPRGSQVRALSSRPRRAGATASSLPRCSSVGRAPRSGRGGRRFEPCHLDAPPPHGGRPRGSSSAGQSSCLPSRMSRVRIPSSALSTIHAGVVKLAKAPSSDLGDCAGSNPAPGTQHRKTATHMPLWKSGRSHRTLNPECESTVVGSNPTGGTSPGRGYSHPSSGEPWERRTDSGCPSPGTLRQA